MAGNMYLCMCVCCVDECVCVVWVLCGCVHACMFQEMTLAELFTIHVNLHAMEFLLIFGETNFVKVPKNLQNLQNLWPSKKERPTVLLCLTHKLPFLLYSQTL